MVFSGDGAEFIIEPADGNDGPEDEFFQNTKLPHPDAPNPSKDFIEKFGNINNEFSISKWSDFEERLEDFIEFGQKHVHLKKPKSNTQKSTTK